MLIDRERQEAIDAGERALDSLYGVRKELESAGNWGLLDMFGGGMFTTFVKHSKMNDAQRYMERAKRDLAAFSRELADVSETLNINSGDFLTFADYFFDGFVADMMVQSRIRDAQRQVDDAIYRVESILSRLRNQG
ncbi:MAG: hypothetical protein ACI3VI_01030 [Vescimonas sp.]